MVRKRLACIVVGLFLICPGIAVDEEHCRLLGMPSPWCGHTYFKNLVEDARSSDDPMRFVKHMRSCIDTDALVFLRIIQTGAKQFKRDLYSRLEKIAAVSSATTLVTGFVVHHTNEHVEHEEAQQTDADKLDDEANRMIMNIAGVCQLIITAVAVPCFLDWLFFAHDADDVVPQLSRVILLIHCHHVIYTVSLVMTVLFALWDDLHFPKIGMRTCIRIPKVPVCGALQVKSVIVILFFAVYFLMKFGLVYAEKQRAKQSLKPYKERCQCVIELLEETFSLIAEDPAQTIPMGEINEFWQDFLQILAFHKHGVLKFSGQLMQHFHSSKDSKEVLEEMQQWATSFIIEVNPQVQNTSVAEVLFDVESTDKRSAKALFKTIKYMRQHSLNVCTARQISLPHANAGETVIELCDHIISKGPERAESILNATKECGLEPRKMVVQVGRRKQDKSTIQLLVANGAMNGDDIKEKVDQLKAMLTEENKPVEVVSTIDASPDASPFCC